MNTEKPKLTIKNKHFLRYQFNSQRNPSPFSFLNDIDSGPKYAITEQDEIVTSRYHNEVRQSFDFILPSISNHQLRPFKYKKSIPELTPRIEPSKSKLINIRQNESLNIIDCNKISKSTPKSNKLKPLTKKKVDFKRSIQIIDTLRGIQEKEINLRSTKGFQKLDEIIKSNFETNQKKNQHNL